MKHLILCSIIYIIRSVNCFSPEDCSYDEHSKHVEYICDVIPGSNFNQRTDKFLYCNNYSPGIDRGRIRILSVLNCREDRLGVDYLDVFTDLRVLNISSVNLETIHADDLKHSKYLEQIIVAQNRLTTIPASLFSYTTELTSLDFSYNQIRELDPFLFDVAHKLTTINFSYNSIEMLNKRIFSKLIDLEAIDFSDNKIQTIENPLLIYNKKLKSFNLRNNQIFHFECEFMLTLTDAPMLQISLNTLIDLKTKCANERTHMEFNVESSPIESSTTLKIADGEFEWIFSKMDYMKLRNLNFSNSHIKNISALLEEASAELTTLDLTNTFVGVLNEKTFQKFTNLNFLYLSRTNLSNFKFETFYHQRNLHVLDISYNNLNSIDFYLFLRNFQYLESLNLEGNNLTDIDSITGAHFPKLSTLAISKNRFSCAYLVKFLLQWHDLKLVDNPSSNQMHIGGVDCFQRYSIENQNHTNGSNNSQINYSTENHTKDLSSIKTLLIVTISILSTLVAICIIFVIYKCVIKRRLRSDSTENIVMTYKKNNISEAEQAAEQNKCMDF